MCFAKFRTGFVFPPQRFHRSHPPHPWVCRSSIHIPFPANLGRFRGSRGSLFQSFHTPRRGCSDFFMTAMTAAWSLLGAPATASRHVMIEGRGRGRGASEESRIPDPLPYLGILNFRDSLPPSRTPGSLVGRFPGPGSSGVPRPRPVGIPGSRIAVLWNSPVSGLPGFCAVGYLGFRVVVLSQPRSSRFPGSGVSQFLCIRRLEFIRSRIYGFPDFQIPSIPDAPVP